MKISCLKVGGRTIKTVVAVFLCLLTGIIRKSDTAFYATIAAVHPNEVLRYLFLSVLLIPIINFSVLIKREKGTFLMCVVFLYITVTHGNMPRCARQNKEPWRLDQICSWILYLYCRHRKQQGSMLCCFFASMVNCFDSPWGAFPSML